MSLSLDAHRGIILKIVQHNTSVRPWYLCSVTIVVSWYSVHGTSENVALVASQGLVNKDVLISTGYFDYISAGTHG